VNTSELFLLKQLVEKAIADNSLFLKGYRDAQARIFAAAPKSE
jgi:hypothetical protein